MFEDHQSSCFDTDMNLNAVPGAQVRGLYSAMQSQNVVSAYFTSR